MNLDSYPLEQIAAKVGTPFYLYDATLLREALARLQTLANGPNLVVRYAMKALFVFFSMTRSCDSGATCGLKSLPGCPSRYGEWASRDMWRT